MHTRIRLKFTLLVIVLLILISNTTPSVHNVGGDCDRNPFRLWRSHSRGGGYLHKVPPFSQKVKEKRKSQIFLDVYEYFCSETGELYRWLPTSLYSA